MLGYTILFARTVIVFGAILSLSNSGNSLAQNATSAETSVERPAIARVAGDTWLTTNASFDGKRWSSVDPSHASFGLWMSDGGYMPNEGKTGAAGFWTHRPDCPRTFDVITESCGWNLGLTVTQWKSVVVGGNTLEIDGNSAAPFGRVVNTTDGDRRFIGLTSNVFGDFSGFDSTARPSWIAGINLTSDTFEVRRLAPTPGAQRVRSQDFADFLTIDRDGNASIGGTVRSSGVTQVNPGQWAARAALREGRFVFKFPRAYTVTPVCVASSEGDVGRLRVGPSKFACVVTSSDPKDESMVDVVVIGNPN